MNGDGHDRIKRRSPPESPLLVAGLP